MGLVVIGIGQDVTVREVWVYLEAHVYPVFDIGIAQIEIQDFPQERIT